MRTIFDPYLKRPAKRSADSNTPDFSFGWQLLCSCLVLLLINGCSSYAVIHNQPGTDVNAGPPYSLKTWAQSQKAEDFLFIVAFSGGGTRAGALAYSVMQALDHLELAEPADPAEASRSSAPHRRSTEGHQPSGSGRARSCATPDPPDPAGPPCWRAAFQTPCGR